MHRVVVVVALSGCAFRPATPPSADNDAPPPPDGGLIGAATCHNQVETPQLCVDFEANSLVPTVADGAPQHLNTVTTTNVTSMGRDGERAAMVDDTSKLVIAENPSLDLSGDFTIELWANVNPLPPNLPDKYWMFNNNTQYGMELLHDGTVRCLINTTFVDTSVAKLPEGSWHHLACVYDSGKLAVFFDGSSINCVAATAAQTDGMDGSAIGGNIGAGQAVRDKFVGGLDNVAVYATALSDDRICQLAGHTGCTAICQSL